MQSRYRIRSYTPGAVERIFCIPGAAAVLVVIAAVFAAGCPAPRPVDLVARLVERLKSPSAAERIQAAQEIYELHFVPPEAVGPLLAMVGDENRDVRIAAAEVLALLPTADAARLDELLAAREREKDPLVRALLERAIERLGGGLPPSR